MDARGGLRSAPLTASLTEEGASSVRRQVQYAAALLQTHALYKVVGVVRGQRLARLSGALRRWLLSWLAQEAAFVHGLPSQVHGLLAPILQAAEDSHLAARQSDATAQAVEAEAAARAAACAAEVEAARRAAEAAAAAAAGGRKDAAREAAGLRQEVRATSHWGGALLVAAAMRSRLRVLSGHALRYWYEVAVLQNEEAALVGLAGAYGGEQEAAEGAAGTAWLEGYEEEGEEEEEEQGEEEEQQEQLEQEEAQEQLQEGDSGCTDDEPPKSRAGWARSSPKS